MFADPRGHGLSTTSAEAASSLNAAIDGFLHFGTEVTADLGEAIRADGDFGFAHAVKGLLLHTARNSHFGGKISQALTAARACSSAMSAREALYVEALEHASRGDITGAVLSYETILAHHPRDLLAQRLAQLELFWIGDMGWSADISARAGAHWDASVPDYGIHLSARAFDLEETCRFDEAERCARQAIEIDPTDPWGAHAAAHVMFMQARHEDGISWLEGLCGNWAKVNQIQFHLWWHLSLFHLEQGEFDAVLDIYDRWVRNRSLELTEAMPDLYIDMQNGASMLLRLELMGLDVAGRWEELCELALNRIDDHTSPFTSAHFAIILAAAGRFEEADRLVRSMREFAHDGAGTLAPKYMLAAIPAARAAIAHRKGDYQGVADHLMPARRLLWEMGGSHAQRDLFFLILADAVAKLGRADLAAIILDDVEHAGIADAAARIGYRPAAELAATQ